MRTGPVGRASDPQPDGVPDLILLDQHMGSGRMIGTDVAAVLRRRGVRCSIVGLSGNDLKDEFLAAGTDSVFVKPLRTDAYRYLADLLARARANRSKR